MWYTPFSYYYSDWVPRNTWPDGQLWVRGSTGPAWPSGPVFLWLQDLTAGTVLYVEVLRYYHIPRVADSEEEEDP